MPELGEKPEHNIVNEAKGEARVDIYSTDCKTN